MIEGLLIGGIIIIVVLIVGGLGFKIYNSELEDLPEPQCMLIDRTLYCNKAMMEILEEMSKRKKLSLNDIYSNSIHIVPVRDEYFKL